MPQGKLTHNVESVRSQMNRLPIEARRELKTWVTDLSVWTKEQLKNKVPVKTGTLKNSIKYRTDYRGADDIGVNFFWAWYGDVLDQGSTFSGRIYPQKAKAFKFEIGSSQVFAKSVVIKPIKARHWSLEVFEEAGHKADSLGTKIEAYLLGMVGGSE